MIMRKLQILCCYVLLSVLCCSPLFGQTQLQEVKKGIVKIKVTDELVQTIGLTPKLHKGIIKTGIPELDKINQEIKAVSMARVFPYSPKFEEKAKRHGLHQWYEIRYENPVTPDNARSLYERVPGVIVAETLRAYKPVQPKIVQPDLSKMLHTRSTAPFNDPFLSAQWHYNNDGKTQDAVIGSDINLYEAWKITTGTPNVVVAIIDGGIDYKHRDIAANMWVNEAELNGTEGVDDDGNGYVDDVYGFNFVDNVGKITPENHGTHVAGTVAAVNNNGVGVGGVAGGSGAGDGIRMMSCQVFVGDITGDFVKSFYYAANNGAVIAQCSWGWPNPDYKEQSVLDAVDYFVKEAGDYEGSPMKGGICIFAAGNQGQDGEFFPGAYPVALAVGAMGNNFKITSYSNSGEWVDIVAPGGVLETISETGVYSTLPNDGYGYMQGTSQACPHVAGIAALVLSKYGNSSYTPEMLRNRLLTAVHDIYKYNPDRIGKVGEGYIDAALALKEDQGKAPQPITDLQFFPDQMTVTAEWTIPNDEDDGFVQKHIIYYSEQEFTSDANLSELKTKVIDTKFNAPGEKLLKEMDGFKSETFYWMAMQAIDRWGHASALSPVQKIKTNKGPEIELSKNNLSLTIDATQTADVTDELGVKNIGEGLLKWTGVLRTAKKQTPSNKSVKAITSPQLASVKKQPVRMSVQPYVANERIVPEYSAAAYPQAFSYYFINDEYLAKLIGETDTTKTNSSAQWFVVDANTYKDGFNLTGISMIGQKQKGRAIIEVYSGESKMSPETLLCSDTLSETNDIYGKTLNFHKQLYFAPGESFWVVVHIPSGNRNPLGAGYVQQELYSAYSYYSSDMGKNWMLLKDALAGGSLSEEANVLCWGIAAISGNPNWGNCITLSPTTGNVRPGESSSLQVASNGQGLINGTYDLVLDLSTNDPHRENVEVPFKVTVSGQKPDLKSAKIADFGKILIGESKTVEIEILNLGYGSFAGKYGAPSYKSSNSEFKVENISSAFPARALSSIKVTFKPKNEGIYKSTVTLTDQYGTTHTINVTGVAIKPAEIAVAPATVDAGDLPYQTSKTVNFTISNPGSYPLEFVMPKYSDDEVDGLKTTSHRFGYSYTSSIYEYNYSDEIMEDMMGAAFELVNATDIKDQYSPVIRWSGAIDLGFKFPFYGQTYDSIYISNRGALSVTGYEGALHSSFPPEAEDMQGIGVISALGSMELEFDDESHLYYTKQNGKFVISYENAKALNNTDYHQYLGGEKYSRVSFRILLSPNGDIEILYLSFPAYQYHYEIDLLNRPDAMYIGIADINIEDPFTIYDYKQAKKGEKLPYMLERQYIKISAPQPNMITKAEPASGVVGMGETQTITLTLTADSTMYKGELKNILTILSNDPEKSTSYVNVLANVTGDYYKPEIVLNRENINFGEVYQGADIFEIITISNKGNADAEITQISLADAHFTLPYSLALPLTVKAGCSYDLLVYPKTSAIGQIADVLKIEAPDGTQNVPVSATIIEAPGISITPAGRNVTMNSGDSQQLDYAIKNTGSNVLEYAIKPQPNFYPVETAQADDEISYVAYNSVDKPELVNFNWIDITKTGTHIDFDYWQKYDFQTVELPFPFTFYGKTYTKVQLCVSGFMSFTEYEDRNNLPGPVEQIPSTDHFYRNFIAPYWGNHSPSETKEAGIYYASQGDSFIVTWVDYANSSNMGVCYQAVLYSDGRIKYQYTLIQPYGNYDGSFGIAGIENEEGTSGILLPDRSIAMDNATELFPVRKHKLAAGAIANVKMMVTTQGLMAGTYPWKAEVSTNVPNKEKMQLGLNLTLTGIPQPVFTPAKIDLGDIIMEKLNDNDYSDAIFNKTLFTVSNTGTAPFKIKRINYKNFTEGLYNFMLMYAVKVGAEEGFMPYMPGSGDDSGEEGGDNTGGGGNQGGGDSGEDDDFGKLSVNPLFGPTPGGSDGTFVISKNTQSFAIAIQNTVTLGVQEDTLEFVTDAGTYKVPVRYNLVESPKAEITQQDYRLYSPNEEFVHDSIFTLTNTGQYPLTYKVAVEYDGVSSTKTVQASAPASQKIAVEAGSIPAESIHINSAQTPQTRADEDKTGDEMYPVDSEYRRNLSYPWGKFIGTMGTGEKYNPFVASIKFQAPADGFNISAIQYVGSIGELESGVIRAEIRNGSESYLDSKVIAEGQVTITGPEVEENGHIITNLRTIEFKNPVYLNPNEIFYVYLHFPAGAPAVLSIAETEEAGVKDRFYAKLVTEWQDLISLEGKYGPIGFTVRCLEKVVGEPWISVQGDVEGQLAVGESKDLTVHVNAFQARRTKGNTAHVVISSNDPQKPQQSFKVTLDKNSGPVITVTDENVSVKENATSVINFTVTDPEGDTFEVALEDANGIATLDQEKSLINLAPQFGHAGNHSLKLTATDAYGYSTETLIEYFVEKVNQAPIVVQPIENINVKSGGIIESIDLTGVFSDPDGDPLTYQVASEDESIAIGIIRNDQLEIVVKGTGETEISVTATDPAHLGATTSFKVNISDQQLSTTQKQIEAYPNPVVYQLSINCPKDLKGEATIRLYSSNGSLYYTEKTILEEGVVKTIDMTNYPSGVYILEIENRYEKLNTKVIKM